MFMAVSTNLMRRYSNTTVITDNNMSDLRDMDPNNVPSVSFDPFLF
jgi:hypothetical protein